MLYTGGRSHFALRAVNYGLGYSAHLVGSLSQGKLVMKHTLALHVPVILALLLVGWQTIPNILADAQQPTPSKESEQSQPAATAAPVAADATATGEGTRRPAARTAAAQESDGEAESTAPADQDAPAQDASGKDALGKDASGKDASGKDASGKDAADKDSAAKDSAPTDAAGKDAAGKDKQQKDKPGKDAPAGAEQVLDSMNAKFNYTVGYSFGQDARQKIQPILGVFEFDLEMFLRGFRDAFKEESLLTEEQMQEIRTELDQEFRRKQQQLFNELAEKNKREGEAFLAANKKQEGVKSSNSGLQYKVLKAGKGRRPTIASRVRVHYRGMFIDGTEFDSSYKRGEPVEFAVSDVIKGWSEALQMMPAGSRWKLFIPAKLAYGEQGRPPIGPNATLVFEVELLEVIE